jgi:thiol:disulfide interchange protein DsbA
VPLRNLWLLAALALGACGGPADPTAETEPTLEPPAGSEAVVEPELVASDPAGAPTTGRFEMGTHYMRLSPTQPTSSSPDQVEVAEIFWYGCPHCFNFDPYLERWQATKPGYVNFVRVPAVWNPLLQLHARAFYAAEALGKGAEMHSEFFREIHERGNLLDSEEKLQAFFGRFGVDAAAFETTFDSFAVQEKLQRADELSRRYRIQSVPTLIVNGKYTTDGGAAGSYDDLLALVDELTAAERAGR